MRYLLIASYWQPRPTGHYEKRVYFYFEQDGSVYSYGVDGAGYGPYEDWWAQAHAAEMGAP